MNGDVNGGRDPVDDTPQSNSQPRGEPDCFIGIRKSTF